MAMRFGEIVVDEGFASEEQIANALKYQDSSQILVGRILVDMHLLTHGQLENVEEVLNDDEHKGRMFGEVAVELKLVGTEDVELAVAFQKSNKSNKGNLGAILIELGYLTEKQRNEILHLQMEGM